MPDDSTRILQVSEVMKMWPMLVMFVGIVGSTSVSQFQLSQHEKEIEDLQAQQQQAIRIEERQKAIKEDVRELKRDVEGVSTDVKEVKDILLEIQRKQ